MTHFQSQIRRIVVAAMAVAAAVLMSGCATTHSNERRLEIWKVGENKDLVLVRGVRPLISKEFDPICKDGVALPIWEKDIDTQGQNLAFVRSRVCPHIGEWKSISGFTKSDFGKGWIGAAGWIQPNFEVDVDDIVEVTTSISEDGRLIRPPIVTRVVRKNALKERDPTCYWDGQSGRFDAFATGGVVCPAEGWDWRDQKWAKK